MRRPRFSVVLVFLVLSAATATTPRAEDQPDALKVAPLTGKAPLTVSLVGPEHLVAKGQGTSQKWTGCGFFVRWGEKAPSEPPDRFGPDCSEGLVHTYRKPGTYVIRATEWHPGPTDGPMIDWSGRAKVIVE